MCCNMGVTVTLINCACSENNFESFPIPVEQKAALLCDLFFAFYYFEASQR